MKYKVKSLFVVKIARVVDIKYKTYGILRNCRIYPNLLFAKTVKTERFEGSVEQTIYKLLTQKNRLYQDILLADNISKIDNIGDFFVYEVKPASAYLKPEVKVLNEEQLEGVEKVLNDKSKTGRKEVDKIKE